MILPFCLNGYARRRDGNRNGRWETTAADRKKIKSIRYVGLYSLVPGAQVTPFLEFSILRYLMSKYLNYDGESMIVFSRQKIAQRFRKLSYNCSDIMYEARVTKFFYQIRFPGELNFWRSIRLKLQMSLVTNRSFVSWELADRKKLL